MGADIHTSVEVRSGGDWVYVNLEPEVFFPRNYGVFGFLGNVRNYSMVPHRWSRRDWPEDATREAMAKRQRYDVNAHSHTYVLLSELLAHEYDVEFEDRRVDRGGVTGIAAPGEGRQVTYREFLTRGGYFDELARLQALILPATAVLVGRRFDLEEAPATSGVRVGACDPTDVRVLMFFDN